MEYNWMNEDEKLWKKQPQMQTKTFCSCNQSAAMRSLNIDYTAQSK